MNIIEYENGELIFRIENRGLNGKVIERTKEKYPYSYDPFSVWVKEYNKNKSKTVYSDRLLQWDYDKYNKCSLEVWDSVAQIFYNREPKDIEKFLNLYLNIEIKLTAIEEGCNVSNGYPYWVFHYEETQ